MELYKNVYIYRPFYDYMYNTNSENTIYRGKEFQFVGDVVVGQRKPHRQQQYIRNYKRIYIKEQ